MGKFCIAFIGGPCSGKTTLARYLANCYGIEHIQSGDIARSMGEDVVKTLDKGMMAPEDMMRSKFVEVISPILAGNKSFVVDGMPRFEDQRIWYESIMKQYGYRLIYVRIIVPVNIMIDRAVKRYRSDDASIKNRIDAYINSEDIKIMNKNIDNSEYVISVNDSGIKSPVYFVANTIMNRLLRFVADIE